MSKRIEFSRLPFLHASKMKKNQDCKNASSESLLIKICTTDKSHRSFILVINWETISCHHDSFQKINKCSFNSSSFLLPFFCLSSLGSRSLFTPILVHLAEHFVALLAYFQLEFVCLKSCFMIYRSVCYFSEVSISFHSRVSL